MNANTGLTMRCGGSGPKEEENEAAGWWFGGGNSTPGSIVLSTNTSSARSSSGSSPHAPALHPRGPHGAARRRANRVSDCRRRWHDRCFRTFRRIGGGMLVRDSSFTRDWPAPESSPVFPSRNSMFRTGSPSHCALSNPASYPTHSRSAPSRVLKKSATRGIDVEATM